jgi:hypothetical protein
MQLENIYNILFIFKLYFKCFVPNKSIIPKTTRGILKTKNKKFKNYPIRSVKCDRFGLRFEKNLFMISSIRTKFWKTCDPVSEHIICTGADSCFDHTQKMRMKMLNKKNIKWLISSGHVSKIEFEIYLSLLIATYLKIKQIVFEKLHKKCIRISHLI